ncbi:two pore channel protein 2-like [Oncorhynchus nerka]|uniref:two pore channel protein 2-like n=1 Tax=Oncorhynchus nerka TaxID=8023 RepID=UPI0031B83373
MKKASQSSSGFIPREAFQRLFDELDKDRIKQHPPLPEYSSKFLRKVQFIFIQHYVTVVGNVICICNPRPLSPDVRLVNMLSVFHFLRFIPHLKLTALFAISMVDLVKHLGASAGILVVDYYVFAVLVVWSFKGTIIAPASNLSTTADPRIMTMIVNKTLRCGSYEQLGYWSNNFDNFAEICSGSIYNIMMVNNWSVFLDVYARYNLWSKLYFIAWWLTSSVMWVNLFIALILENFIYKWDRNHGCSNRETVRTDLDTTIQLMFRQQIAAPTEEKVVTQLHAHPHLQHLTMSMSLDQI